MMRVHFKICILLIAIGFIYAGCAKENDVDPPGNNTDSAHAAICNQFSYSDTLYFISDQVANHRANPVVNQAGKYGAFPGGLAIDSVTGSININASETGLKYHVWFIPNGFSDTCKTFVTISGVHYTDSIYVLNSGDKIARPYYNAVRGGVPPCSGDDDDDDDDPPTGNQLRALGIDVNVATGLIDLEQTVNNGTFGATPVNGSFKDVTMFYRLNDASLHALNKIDLRIYYFDTRAQVPASLIAEMNLNQSGILRTRASSKITGLIKKPRPPIIVIVRSL